MESRFVVAGVIGAVLTIMPATLSAATYVYTYTGNFYQDVTDRRAILQPDQTAFGRPDRPAYSKDMRVTASFTFDQRLPSDAYVTVDTDGTKAFVFDRAGSPPFSTGSFDGATQREIPVLDSFVFDGINRFDQVNFADFFTVDLGSIAAWDINLIRGGSDADIIMSNWLTGDRARYFFEFGYIDPNVNFGLVSADEFFASTPIPGTWSLTVIPVPATLPLLIGGMGALGLLRRRQRKA